MTKRLRRESRAAAEQALAVAQQGGEADEREVVWRMLDVAETYVDPQECTTAEAILRDALRVAERIDGHDGDLCALVLSAMAGNYLLMQQYETGILMAERALRIAEQNKGADHTDVAAHIGLLGSLHVKLGQFSQAGPLLIKALGICEREFGTTDALAGPIFNLATFFNDQAIYSVAEALYTRCIDMVESREEPHCGTLGLFYSVFADHYERRGLDDLARSLRARALAQYEKDDEIEDDHPAITKLRQKLTHNVPSRDY